MGAFIEDGSALQGQNSHMQAQKRLGRSFWSLCLALELLLKVHDHNHGCKRCTGREALQLLPKVDSSSALGDMNVLCLPRSRI